MKRSVIFFLLLLCIPCCAQSSNALRKQLQAANKGVDKITILHALSDIYLSESDKNEIATDSAFYFANAALNQSIKANDTEYTCRSQILMARVYLRKKQKGKARNFARKTLNTATANNLYDICGDAYLELYNQLNFYEELDQKTKYLEASLAAYNKKSSKKQRANILALAADHYNYLGQIDKSMTMAQQSLNIYKSLPDASLTNIYRIQANNYYSKGLNKKATEYFLIAARHGEKLNKEHELLSYIYNQLAALYHHLNNHETSTIYLHKALEQAIIIKDKEAIYTAANNITQNLVNKGKYKEADKFLTAIVSKYPPQSKIDIITVKLCYLTIYMKLRQLAKAQKYCDELHKIADGSHKELPAGILFNINLTTCRFYLAKGDYETAQKYLNNNLQNIEKSEGFIRRKTTYYLAYQIDSTRGNYIMAIEYLNKVRRIDDSLFDVSKNNEIARLQIEYETEKKDQDIRLKAQNIKLLAKETELEKNKTRQAKKIRNIAFGVILLVIAFCALLYWAYKNKQKVNALLRRQQAEITDKNNILSHLLDEKEWLLKEVHHRVKNNLQIVMSLLNSQSAYLKDKAAVTAIKDSQRRVHAMSLIHQKVYQSENLSSINIKTYISELVYFLKDTFDNGNIDITVQAENVDFDVSQVVPVGLILNEAITNSVKYAFNGTGRGTINISLTHLGNDVFELRIADNGVGININIENTDSLGMNLIQGLSRDLNGTFKMYNDNGAIIIITFMRDLHVKPAS